MIDLSVGRRCLRVIQLFILQCSTAVAKTENFFRDPGLYLRFRAPKNLLCRGQEHLLDVAREDVHIAVDKVLGNEFLSDLRLRKIGKLRVPQLLQVSFLALREVE